MRPAIREQIWGHTHPDIANSLNSFAKLYEKQKKYAKANLLYQRALAIAEQALGPEHPNTQTVRGNYEDLLKKMGGEKD